jgi:hypothetical protein
VYIISGTDATVVAALARLRILRLGILFPELSHRPDVVGQRAGCRGHAARPDTRTTFDIEALLPDRARAVMWRKGCTAADDLRTFGLKRC